MNTFIKKNDDTFLTTKAKITLLKVILARKVYMIIYSTLTHFMASPRSTCPGSPRSSNTILHSSSLLTHPQFLCRYPKR